LGGLWLTLLETIGRLIDALDANRLGDDTVVIYTSDHGELLGEHGLWRKMSFYEQAARVPLQISWPGVVPAGRPLPQVASLVDVTATVLDIAGVPSNDLWEMDGDTLLPLMRGESTEWKDEAFVEHHAHGTDRPRAMVRRGSWKLSYSHGNPPELELYDLDADPGEFTNLAGSEAHREVQDRLLSSVLERWGDPDRLTHEIVASQEARLMMRLVTGDEAPF